MASTIARAPALLHRSAAGHELEEVPGYDGRHVAHDRAEAGRPCRRQQRAQERRRWCRAISSTAVDCRQGCCSASAELARARRSVARSIGPTRRESVDEPEQLVVVAQRVGVEPVDERTAVRRDGEPALAIEGDDRLAHGDPAHARAVGRCRPGATRSPWRSSPLKISDADVDGDEVAAAATVHERNGREAGVVRIRARPRCPRYANPGQRDRARRAEPGDVVGRTKPNSPSTASVSTPG